jgi:site-specific DNA recombinase
MKALGYIRVSTKEQSREGASLSMQAHKIQKYCDLNDMELTEIIEDAGLSGKSIKGRPGIQRVLELVKDKTVGAVVVYKLDRLARNTIECLNISKLMDKAGVALHSITEKLDTSSAMGRFFFTLTASLAEMEQGVISERTTAVMQRQKEKGERVGGRPSYGWTVEKKVWKVNEDEQAVISRMKVLQAKGYTYEEITLALADEGVKTRKGTTFTKTQIFRILKAA